VVIYLIDTLRADHIGAYGYPKETTPVLDAFAKEAAVFERAYAQASWTRASVGTLLTGLYPSRHGAVRREHRLSAEVATLPGLLREAGFTTAGFTSNPNLLPLFGFDRGFDTFRDVNSGSMSTRAENVHSAVFEYLDTAPEAPLFLYIHTLDPHHPYDPPPPFDTRFVASEDSTALEMTIARYDGEIAYNDREFGTLLERLRIEGIYDETYLVVLSDHGEEFMEHGRSGHGMTLFQEQLHVPLMIRFPAARHAGKRIATPVRAVDLMPTLLGELDVPVPAGIDGQSLSGLLDGTETAYQPVHFAEQDVDQHMLTSLVEGDRKIIRRHRPTPLRGVELYDLSRDPGERADLFSPNDAVSTRMLAKLIERERGVWGGTTVEFTNASPLAARHRLEGSLEAVGGHFVNWSASRLEDGDWAELGDSRRRVTFDLRLANQENPVIDTVLVDVDRLRFGLEPGTAKIRLRLRVDDVPRPRFDVLLGNAKHADSVRLPFTSRTDTAQVVVAAARPAAVLLRTRPFARVFTVPVQRPSTVEIPPEIDARLRALGYTGEP
jgi:arylsulfatase